MGSHRGIADSCREGVLSAGTHRLGWQGGSAGHSRLPGGLSGARGQESELGGRLMIEDKSENMSQ